jgi:hypothetical protein
MATQRLQFTEWLPDQPAMAGSLNDAKNVYPLSLGYAPFPNAVDYSDAASENLNNIFVGKFGADVQVFGGGSTKLFKMDNTDLSMDDVSTAGGYSSTDNWQFRQFGKKVLACNNSARLQAWEIGSSTNFYESSTYKTGTYSRSGTTVTVTITAHGLTTATNYRVDITSGTGTDGTYTITVVDANTFTYTDSVSGTTSGNINVFTSSAPIAKYVTVVRDFVVCGNLDTGTNANKVAWSDINDESYWDSGSTSQSDYQILPDGGNITGLAGGEFGLVFLEKAVVRMSYIGSPLFFQFDTISRGLGCLEGNSIATYGNTSFFLSDDGFYSCDGTNVVGIGTEKVDRWFFDDCSLTDIGSMTTAIDPVKKLVVWNYKAVDGKRHMLVYNWQISKWSRIETDATVVGTIASTGTTLESFETAYLVTAGSFVVGKEYEIYGIGSTDFTLIGAASNTVGLKFTATGVGSGTGTATDIAAAAAGKATLETLVASLDSRLWIGGKLLFAGAKDTKIVTFTGSTYNSEIITTDVEVGYNSIVTLARPTIDNGTANVKIASRKELDDNVLFGSSVSTSSEGRASIRSYGRYHRLSIIPTGTTWTNAVGVDVDIVPTGTR